MADAPQPWTWLTARRVEARLTQTELARAAGISKQYLCEIENGTKRLAFNVKILGALADELGVPILELDRSRPPARPGQRQRRTTITTSSAA